MSDSRLIGMAAFDEARKHVFASGPGRLCWGSFRILGPLIACVGALFFCLGQFAGAVQKGEKILRADAVVAERFELTGPDGKRSALLHTNAAGEPLLSFFDEKGSLRLDVGISPRGQPGLTLYDATTREKLSCYVRAQDGIPNLTLSSGGLLGMGNTIFLSITENGPAITISKTSGGRVSMALNNRGEPKIGLWGTENEPRISLLANEDGPNISMMGKKGMTRTSWRVVPDGSPAILLADDQGKNRLLMMVFDDGPAISLKGKNGVTRTNWRLLPDGSPAFFLADDQGRDKLIMTIDKDGKPTVRNLGAETAK